MPLAATLDIHDGGFTWYIIGLWVSGLLQLAFTIFGFGLSKGGRFISALFAALFLGYGSYLAFIFSTGGYRYFPYAIGVPVLFLINIYRLWSERRKASAESATGG